MVFLFSAPPFAPAYAAPAYKEIHTSTSYKVFIQVVRALPSCSRGVRSSASSVRSAGAARLAAGDAIGDPHFPVTANKQRCATALTARESCSYNAGQQAAFD